MNLLPIFCAIVSTAAAATSNPDAFGPRVSSQQADYGAELGNAAESGDTEYVQVLLADARVNPAASNNSAIGLAAQNGHAECIKLLLADPRVNPAADTNCAIRYAASNGHVRCVQALLADPRVDPSADDNYALRWAARNGHMECVQLLLADPRVDPAASNNYAIAWAAYYGCAKCIRILLADPRVDPAANGNYAMHWAVHYAHGECVKVLLADPRVDPAANDNHAVRSAAQRGHMECVKVLLADPRVDPNAISQVNCHPPLCCLIDHTRACKDGDLEAFQQMCVAGLSDDALDIFISRNRSFPEVHSHLLSVQLAHLAVPETVASDPTFETCINLARSRGLWRTSELRELTKTFICLKNICWLFGEYAAVIAVHAHGLVS